MGTFILTMTQQQVDKLIALMQQHGQFQLESQGTLPTFNGVSLSYADNFTQDGMHHVTFTILQKPFFVKESFIENYIINAANS